jgi:hypothetical protein
LKLASLVERAPFRVRVASAIGSLAAISLAAGEHKIAAVLAAAAAAAGLAPPLAERLRRGLSADFKAGLARSPGGEGSGVDYYEGFEIEVSAPQHSAFTEISKLIADRARFGGSRILVASLLESGRGRVLVLVYSRDKEKVRVDYEVLKTMLASSGSVRIRELGGRETEILAEVARNIAPSSRAAPLIVRPPGEERTAESGLRLGVRIDAPLPEPVYLTREDVEGHIAVFGSTGTGKSTTLSIIACQAWKSLGARVVVLDWAGEHSEKLSAAGCKAKTLDPLNEASINPLSLVEREEDAVAIVEAMSASLSLTEPQEYMLLKAIEEGRPKSVEELEAVIEAMPESSRWDRDVKRALQRKIAALTRGSSKSAFKGSPAPQQPTEPVVIDVSRIPALQARRAYTLLALWRLYRESERGLKSIVFIDEAHNVAIGEEGLLSKLLAEARKRGLRLAIATQSPSLMPTRVIANANTKIVHALRSHRDLEVVREALYLPERLVQKLPILERGEALLHSPSHPNPVLIKVSR